MTVLAAFGLDGEDRPDLSRWQEVLTSIREPEGEVNIAIVGKYTELKDAYKSDRGAASRWYRQPGKVNLDWIDARF